MVHTLVYRKVVQARLLILRKNSKISQLLTQRLLSYSVLLLPARLFGPALLFGTLG